MELKRFLPSEVIIELNESNSSLSTFNIRGFLETPDKTFFRLMKARYYSACLRGVPLDKLPKLDLVEVSKELGASHGKAKYFRYESFLSHWLNPGFSYRVEPPYLVRSDLTPLLDHMHLKVTFGQRYGVGTDEVAREWFRFHECILDTSAEEAFHYLRTSQDLPSKLRDRLNLYVESDSVVKEEFLRNPPNDGEKVLLVSRDLKLAAELVRLAEARGAKISVYALRPAFYLVGMGGDVGFEPDRTIEDSGALLFEDMTVFSEGDCPDWVWSGMETREVHRYKGVWVIDRLRP
jgi:hypothetical protein